MSYYMPDRTGVHLERKSCVVKGLLPGKQTSNVSMTQGDNVASGVGWGVGVLDFEELKL